MRTIKQSLSLLLLICLCWGLGLPALAEDPTTVLPTKQSTQTPLKQEVEDPILIQTPPTPTHTTKEVGSDPILIQYPPELFRSNTIADIAETSSPQVVWIITTYETPDSNLPPSLRRLLNDTELPPTQGMGSGFFFDSRGYIMTNAHVVEGSLNIEVLLKDSKEPLPAKLVGIDKELDIAVLQVKREEPFPSLELGDSDLARIGEWVIAIGNPYGLDHTVTLGIISAKGRPIVVDGNKRDLQTYDNMIQTDAAINPGNSGGPLLDLQGKVIGINTAVSSSGQGLSFAIPINSVKEVLGELISKGKISRPWLGVTLTDIKTLDSQTKKYLKITQNEGILLRPLENSPAAQGGVKYLDLLTEINHQPITTIEELINYIRNETKVGDTVELLIIRDNLPMAITVILGEKP